MNRYAALLLAVVLTGCATKADPPTLFDLGSLPAPGNAISLPPLAIADVVGSPFLDNPQMFYRLSWVNDQQPHPFAHSRWTMPPSQLLEQRVKARLGQAGNAAVSALDGALNVPLVRIEADDFALLFDSPSQSHARVAIRAAVYRGRLLLAQKSFSQQQPAATADAAGGARALADASDAVITELTQWLATLPLTTAPTTTPRKQ